MIANIDSYSVKKIIFQLEHLDLEDLVDLKMDVLKIKDDKNSNNILN